MNNSSRISTLSAPAGLVSLSECEPELFSDLVSTRVKPSGRDEFVAALTVRLQPDSIAHPRSLLLEITDENDLLFYHSLMLGEADYHALKTEQRLHADFQSFPTQLTGLLRRCCADGSGVGGGTPSSIEGMRMLACLECGGGGESLLSIVEAHPVRDIQHIALRLRTGTDETVKQHLAGKLRETRAEAMELNNRLGVSEDALVRARRQVEELGARSQVVAEERQHLELTMQSTHTREVAELRQEHAIAHAELHRNASEDRARVETKLSQSLEEALARAARAEQAEEELKRHLQELEASNSSLSERFATSEAQQRESRQEVLQLHEQVKQLELARFKHERELGEERIQATFLKEQLAMKEQLVTNQMSQIEQATVQRKSLEETLSACRSQVQGLEDKLAQSNQEIVKGNQTIQDLYNKASQFKAKLSAATKSLAKQESAMLEHKHGEKLNSHVLVEKEQDISRGKERENQLRLDAETLRKQLGEAHDVIKSNKDVIDTLNQQVTERDLQAMPIISGSSIPFNGAQTEGGRGRSFAEIMRRAEGRSSSLTGATAARGYSGSGLHGTWGAGMGTGGDLGRGALSGLRGFATSPLAPAAAPAAEVASGAASGALGSRLHGPVGYRQPSAFAAGQVSA